MLWFRSKWFHVFFFTAIWYFRKWLSSQLKSLKPDFVHHPIPHPMQKKKKKWCPVINLHFSKVMFQGSCQSDLLWAFRVDWALRTEKIRPGVRFTSSCRHPVQFYPPSCTHHCLFLLILSAQPALLLQDFLMVQSLATKIIASLSHSAQNKRMR